MDIKKIKIVIFYLSFSLILSGCIQSTSSLFGPSITIAKTGNVYQGGVSFVSNQVINKKFGKPPVELIENLFKKNSIKNEAKIIINKKNNLENTLSLVTEINNEQKHSDFISAVKKILN